MIFSFFYPHLFDELRSLDRSFFVEELSRIHKGIKPLAA